MRSLYRALGYDFPRLLTLDVRDCVLVEVENPLPKPFALSTFWLPNVVLSCDYLISIAPFKIFGNQGRLSISNLLSLLPISKYRGEAEYGWGVLYGLGIQRVIADLHFTLPFDLGIIEGSKRFIETNGDLAEGFVEGYGKILVGEPYEVDWEASQAAELETDYLRLIDLGKRQLAT